MPVADFDPTAHVDEAVTVTGTARNAAAGAMLRVEGVSRPIYILGLDSWSGELVGSTVEVSGVLRVRGPQVQRGADEPEHGLDTATFVLDDAEWAPAGQLDAN
jgi:hypothetical protein